MLKKVLVMLFVFTSCNICFASGRNLVEKDFKVYYIACLDAYGNYDVNLLCAVNKNTGEVRLVSMLRDLDINGNKLNAYSKTKIDGMRDIINTTYDVNIYKYVSISWKDAIKILNEFNPITVALKENEKTYINAYIHNTCDITGIDSLNPAKHYVDVSKQTLQLTGLQLVAYCRLRYGASDYTRTGNQREIIKNLISQIKSKSIIDLSGLFLKYMHCLKTDIGLMDFKSVVGDMQKFNITASSSFPDRKLVTSVNYHLVPIDINKCKNDLHKKLFNNDFYSYEIKR